MNIYQKLALVQEKLKVSKDNFNKFGNYNYRSCEDILEGAKPLLKEVGAIVTLTDSVELIGDRHYIKATATFIDTETESLQISTCALAREDLTKKGMDLAQVTGSVSSYARKYALNGLFCIDDTKDSDTTNTGNTETPKSKTVETPTDVEKLYQPTKKAQDLYDLAATKNITVAATITTVRTKYNKRIEELTDKEYEAVKKAIEAVKI